MLIVDDEPGVRHLMRRWLERGDEVWLGARIVHATDAYDAMTRSRIFRDPIPASAALAELARCTGTQFDGRVVDALTHMLN